MAALRSWRFRSTREKRCRRASPHDEADHGLAKLDLIAVLQPRAARIAMDFLAEAVADNPEAAVALRFACALIPAVVVKPVFTDSLVIKDVRVLSRNGAVDFVVLREREVVAPRWSVQSRNVDGPADIGARLFQ